MENQARQNPSIGGRGEVGSEAQALEKKLSASADNYQREFFSRMQPLNCIPCSPTPMHILAALSELRELYFFKK